MHCQQAIAPLLKAAGERNTYHAQQDAPRDAKSEGGESNGCSRRRSSRGPRSNGRVKDPAEQPQPDVEVAAEPAELVAEPAVESATDAEVKKAFRTMAKKYHPDKLQHMDEAYQKGAREKFQNVQEAYETIQKERGF